MADAFDTLRAAGFRGAAARAVPADFQTAAARLGTGSREMRAVIAVESAGAGFYSDGRCKMLFEPHVFFRLLAGDPDKQEMAIKAGLAYPKWGTKPYPKDSYPRLIQALVIDEAAALKAASWGLTQIMGENHAACGYATPRAMVAAFAAGEAAQLVATADLMASKGLGKAMRAHDWPAVAKGWNGAAYRKLKYDDKLALAFKNADKAPAAAPPLASTKGKAPPPLPAVAPLTLGQSIAGFFARLTRPATKAA